MSCEHIEDCGGCLCDACRERDIRADERAKVVEQIATWIEGIGEYGFGHLAKEMRFMFGEPALSSADNAESREESKS